MSLVEPQLAERVLARALERGGDLAELYAEDRHGFMLSLDDGRVERPQDGRERGAGVRVIDGESTYYGYVDGLREDDLMNVAGSVAQAVRRRGAPAGGAVAAEPPGVHPIGTAPESVDASAKAELLRLCDEHARASGAEVAQVRIGFAQGRRLVEVFNSDGLAAADDRTRVRLSAQVVARRDGRVETGSDTRGGHAGWDCSWPSGPRRWPSRPPARRSRCSTRSMPRPGRLPVVVGNGFGGVLLHEAVGHGLEADAIQKRASVYAGKLGEKLAEGFVTAYDDGRRSGEWGSDGIDDEGTATRRTTVIEDGELTSYLYDLLRARKDGVDSTGNGRRESFRHTPALRMTNTYFAPGEASAEELIGGVSAASTRSHSAAGRWSRPPATSCSASPRAT